MPTRKRAMTMNRDASPGAIAESLLTKLIEQLANRDGKATGAGKVIFFPNGIELIYLKVTVSQYSAEIKVAGEKAPTELALEAATSSSEG